MKPLLRQVLIATSVIALSSLAVVFATRGGVPRAFFEARIKAIGAANNIAVLTNNSLSNLRRIEEFEKNGSIDQANSLTEFEIGQKFEKQNAAVLLATHLDEMARAGNTISSAKARSLAISAVTTGVSLVSRIVSYNNALDQVFAAIQEKILSGDTGSVNIRALIASLNSDAKAINDLNIAFNQSLKEFDVQYGTGEEDAAQ
jgi:hypothetical protein